MEAILTIIFVLMGVCVFCILALVIMAVVSNGSKNKKRITSSQEQTFAKINLYEPEDYAFEVRTYVMKKKTSHIPEEATSAIGNGSLEPEDVFVDNDFVISKPDEQGGEVPETESVKYDEPARVKASAFKTEESVFETPKSASNDEDDFQQNFDKYFRN